jgi:hypothetical protein
MRQTRKRTVGVNVANEKPIETRVELVEHELRAQSLTLNNVVSTVNEIRDIVTKQPAAASMTERVTLIGATAGIVMTFMTLANTWFDSRIAPDRQIIGTISRNTDQYPVFAYRLEQAEKQLEKLNSRQAPAL